MTNTENPYQNGVSMPSTPDAITARITSREDAEGGFHIGDMEPFRHSRLVRRVVGDWKLVEPVPATGETCDNGSADQVATPAVASELTEAHINDLLAHIGHAISDPGKVVRRGDDYNEPVAAWSMRAVSVVLRWWFGDHALVNSDDYARLIQYRRENIGLICPQGHHTRFADVLGDPNDDSYVCAHCAVRAGVLVELREPDATNRHTGDPQWSGYGVEISGGQVWDGTRHLRPRGARVYAAELMSAAEHIDSTTAFAQQLLPLPVPDSASGTVPR